MRSIGLEGEDPHHNISRDSFPVSDRVSFELSCLFIFRQSCSLVRGTVAVHEECRNDEFTSNCSAEGVF